MTTNAMNTHKSIAKAILEEAHRDYCLEGKPENAYLESKKYFACEEFLKEILTKEGQYYKETEEATYDTITREDKRFAFVARKHRHIENDLHWVLAIIFKEDKLRSKEKNGLPNFGLIR